MFRRLLIANRGEIAVRIIRACRELGIESVAVYSDADSSAPHRALADRAVRIGPAPAAHSYLSTEAVLRAAKETGAEAIHPGYGFLAENHTFAAACIAGGLIFVGPPPDVIASLGSKIAARHVAARAGIPVVPGETPSDQSEAAIADAARQIGFPVLIKPSAGGGGIGMKAVLDEASLPAAIAQGRREAIAAFGDGTLYVERLIDRPRHVEVQVLLDGHGNAVYLFERECSLQRRHQKIVEEAPSTALTSRLRARMGEAAVALASTAGYRNAGTVEFLLEGTGDEARFYFLEMNTRLQVEHPVTEQSTGVDIVLAQLAVAAARAVGYVNAGTIEFLLDGRGVDARFYFLEMNTRLQVEHPITEAVTGVDLVRAQLAVAAGEPLPWSQGSLTQRGHAIECRVYAEDPGHDFLPQAGPLLLYREPGGPGIRIDSGVREGDRVSVEYDPLLAKLIASGETRAAATARAIQALREYPVLGIRTNIPFLIRLLEHPVFAAGDLHTGVVDELQMTLAHASHDGDVPPAALAAAALAGAAPAPDASGTVSNAADPWDTLAGWGR